MSDRVNGFIVVLDRDYNDDDIEATINAIKQIKGVISVKPNVATPNDEIVAMREKHKLIDKVYGLIEEILKNE